MEFEAEIRQVIGHDFGLHDSFEIKNLRAYRTLYCGFMQTHEFDLLMFDTVTLHCYWDGRGHVMFGDWYHSVAPTLLPILAENARRIAHLEAELAFCKANSVGPVLPQPITEAIMPHLLEE